METIPEGDEGTYVENGTVPDETEPQTSDVLDRQSTADGTQSKRQESPSRPLTPDSGVPKDLDVDQLGFEDTVSTVDDEEIASITTEFSDVSDVSGDSGVDELPPQPDVVELLGQPEFAAKMGEIINDNRDLLPPDQQLPVPAAKTSGADGEIPAGDDDIESISIEGDSGNSGSEVASLSIKGGGVDSKPVVKSEGSVDIDGGGNTTKKSIGQRFLDALKKIGNWLGTHKLQALFVIFTIAAFLSLLIPVPGANILFATFFAACALACLGVSLGFEVHDRLNPQQSPSQTNNGQNQNPQNTPDGKTPTGPEKPAAKTEPVSSPGTGAGDTDGKFVMSESRPVSAANSGGQQTARGARASTVATQTVGGQNDDDLTQNLDKLRNLINESFSPFSNKAHAPEQWDRHSQDPNAEFDEKTLEEISVATTGLFDQFRHIADDRDIKGSDTFQNARMDEVERQMKELMGRIQPTDEFIERLTNKVYMQFSDPRLPPDPSAPPLTIGEMRGRLENFADKDMKGIEFFDLLTELVRASKAYREDRMMHQFGQARPEPIPSPVQTPRPVTPPEQIPSPVQEPAPSSVKPVVSTPTSDSGVSLDDERPEEAEERRKRVINQLIPKSEYETDLDDTSNCGVNGQAVLMDIRTGILGWREVERQRKVQEGEEVKLTEDNYKELVATALGHVAFSVARQRLQNAKIDSVQVDLKTEESRKAFLGEVFDSNEVQEIMDKIEAKPNEQQIAMDYFLKRTGKGI
ncbi:hypothetical protein [Endozoicomonas atrinae]|uniref:hypothetical protein n=1 Tax=Endozoicomonas atrinae TaxID=1333660 RepID=UPI003AFF65BA